MGTGRIAHSPNYTTFSPLTILFTAKTSEKFNDFRTKCGYGLRIIPSFLSIIQPDGKLPSVWASIRATRVLPVNIVLPRSNSGY